MTEITSDDLADRLAAIRRKIDVLRGQEALLMELMGSAPGTERVPRSGVKQMVIDLLEEVGPKGLNATMAVALAREGHDVRLDRGSVSSLLSRMKSDGFVTYVDGLYRLREHTQP
jgi:hypothetical protein